MVNLKKLQFTKDKGILVSFLLVDLVADVQAEMQFTTFDMKAGDRFYADLQNARYGVEKMVFGPNQAARRRRLLGKEESDQFGEVEMSVDSVSFGGDDNGDYVIFVMAAGIKNFEDIGALKLPKAYYKKREESYNLFPVEDQDDLVAVKAGAERMILNYLKKIGRACETVFDKEFFEECKNLVVDIGQGDSVDSADLSNSYLTKLGG
jgi:hypothetical protein